MDKHAKNLMTVEIAYAVPTFQLLLEVRVPIGSTIVECIKLSNINDEYPQINMSSKGIGIFGKTKNLDYVVQEHDRIEIYRPLTQPPHKTRLKRGNHNKPLPK